MEKYKISGENILFMDNSMKAAHCKEEKKPKLQIPEGFCPAPPSPSPHKCQAGSIASLITKKHRRNWAPETSSYKREIWGPGLMGLRGSHKTKVPLS